MAEAVGAHITHCDHTEADCGPLSSAIKPGVERYYHGLVHYPTSARAVTRGNIAMPPRLLHSNFLIALLPHVRLLGLLADRPGYGRLRAGIPLACMAPSLTPRRRVLADFQDSGVARRQVATFTAQKTRRPFSSERGASPRSPVIAQALPGHTPLTEVARYCAPNVRSVRCPSPPTAVHYPLRSLHAFTLAPHRPAAEPGPLSATFLIVVTAPTTIPAQSTSPADSHATHTRVIRVPDEPSSCLKHLPQRWWQRFATPGRILHFRTILELELRPHKQPIEASRASPDSLPRRDQQILHNVGAESPDSGAALAVSTRTLRHYLRLKAVVGGG
ncbi:hypothetical protein V8D89_008310 [Ganoderma adspersum]